MGRVRHRRYTKSDIDTTETAEVANEGEVTWLREEEIIPETPAPQPEVSRKSPECENNNHFPRQLSVKTQNEKNVDFECKQTDEKWPCAVYQALLSRKIVVAEWQRIACVIDRFLFWFYFISTIVAYVVILVIIPGQRRDAREEAKRVRQNSIFNTTIIWETNLCMTRVWQHSPSYTHTLERNAHTLNSRYRNIVTQRYRCTEILTELCMYILQSLCASY